MTETSRYLRPIKRGEYDLANISNIGFDPITGKSFEECHDEWSNLAMEVSDEVEKLRWWDLIRRYICARKVAALISHRGF